MRQMRGNPLYETADLHQPGVTHKVDITSVPLAGRRLRRGDGPPRAGAHRRTTAQAMRELFRLLKPGRRGAC